MYFSFSWLDLLMTEKQLIILVHVTETKLAHSGPEGTHPLFLLHLEQQRLFRPQQSFWKIHLFDHSIINMSYKMIKVIFLSETNTPNAAHEEKTLDIIRL